VRVRLRCARWPTDGFIVPSPESIVL
jgi:hypothetical protein